MNRFGLTLLHLSVIFAVLFSGISCDDGEQFAASYAHDIDPIFHTRCLPCHLTESGNSNDLNLSTYESLMAGNSINGPVVIPYDADNSLLYEAVAIPTEEQSKLSTRMPQGDNPLSTVQIKLIEDWINEGAKNN